MRASTFLRPPRYKVGEGKTEEAFQAKTLLIILLSGFGCLWAAAATQAAPVTFRFEAVIGPPNTVSPLDVPFDLPFLYKEGDTISGMLTVEPIDAEPSIGTTSQFQNLDVAWNINGYHFATSHYRLVVQDNLFVIDGIERPYDEIIVDCSPIVGSQAACQPNMLEGSQDILWGFALGLAGDQTTLDGADIPSDSDTWNAFNLGRGLNMSFREASGTGIMRLSASLGYFAVVPEPTGMVLLECGTISFALLFGKASRAGRF